MAKYEITASIVLYKTDRQEVQNIINKFLDCSLQWRLYLIDNSPKATLKDTFEFYHQNIEYIFVNKNLGFGKAHNIAFDKVKDFSKFHLVLNSDIEFKPSILSEMVSYMEKNKDVGLLAPKVLNFDGSIQYTAKLLPRPIDLIVRRFIPIEIIQDYFNNKYELRFFDFKKEIETPCYVGCFLLIKCNVLSQIKGFDERFFMYSEDIDFTRRINEIYRTVYYPKVEVFHKHGKGSYKSLKLLYYHVNSMIRYFNKWGWFFDLKRKKVNRKVFLTVKINNNKL